MPFTECSVGTVHVAHEVCLAREMASLKIINLVCTICNNFTTPTLHEDFLGPTEAEDFQES